MIQVGASQKHKQTYCVWQIMCYVHYVFVMYCNNRLNLAANECIQKFMQHFNALDVCSHIIL